MLSSLDPIDRWFLERSGKFTASEIGKLLSKGKGTEMFGNGAMAYIKQKAIEELTDLFERPYLDYLKPFLHGKAHEYPAFEMYRKVTRNNSMRYFGTDEPIYLAYNDSAGGSPDGLMGEGSNIELGLELKCPINPCVHADYLKMKDQFDLKQYDEGYYAQVQFLLMITKAKGWHWSSFDDRYKNPKLKIAIIEVLPDKTFQDNLDIRVQQAIKIKKQIVQEYENNN